MDEAAEKISSAKLFCSSCCNVFAFCKRQVIKASIYLCFYFCSHLTDKSPRWEDPGGRTGSASGDGSQGNGSGPNIPSLLSMATRSHMDITTPPLPQVNTILEAFSTAGERVGCQSHSIASLQVSAEVLRVAEHRHRRGLMYPQIYHILTKVKDSIRVMPSLFLHVLKYPT